ncbi:MAG: hypothetical protein IJD13_03295 [Oscillospiraceae bacterium]|nr:hypothetical protein [Oscillospiraceae bacterium]
MRAVIRFAKEVWHDQFGRTEYLIFHILAVLCCSIFAVSPYYIQGLFFPWLDLRVPPEWFIVLLVTASLGWMAFAAVIPMECGRMHTGQILITACFGFSFCNTLLLMQHRPLWAILLFFAACMAGRRIPAEEYQNDREGGHIRTARYRQRTLMRRANTIVVCMAFSWALLAVSRISPVQVQNTVLAAVREEKSVSVTDEYWQEMSEGERYQTMLLILDKECAAADVPRPELTIAPLDESTLAGFFPETYNIVLDDDLLAYRPAQTCIYVLLHEFRHCWQYELSRTSPDKLPDHLRGKAETFRENLADYRTSAVYGYDAYYTQPIEADARDYAGSHFAEYCA